MAKAGYGKRRMKSQHNKQWNKTVKDLKKSAKPFKDAARTGKKIYRKTKRKNKGCYIATCVYGNYDCPQVWTLRRFRDGVLEETWYGRLFIKIYYKISPLLVRVFGNCDAITSHWRRLLDIFICRLIKSGFSDQPYND